MNDRLNQLRMWMDAARELGIGGGSALDGRDPMIRARNSETRGNAMRMWAERMMGDDMAAQGQPEDFFAGDVPAYQAPARFSGRPPETPQPMNYLARMRGMR
jgi:hypothetical protein